MGASSCHVFWRNWSSQCAFSQFPGHWCGAHVMCCGAWCRNHKVNRAQNQLITYIFSIPVSLVGSSHVMCSRSLVSTPQLVAGTKPAHYAQFSLFPRHWRLGAHVMCSRAWCRNHKVIASRNQLTMYIFSIPVSLASSSCQVLWGPGP